MAKHYSSHWNFLYSAQILHCHIPVLVLSIQSKIWSSFLSALLNWRQNSNFFKLTALRSDFMKRNFGRFIFTHCESDRSKLRKYSACCLHLQENGKKSWPCINTLSTPSLYILNGLSQKLLTAYTLTFIQSTEKVMHMIWPHFLRTKRFLSKNLSQLVIFVIGIAFTWSLRNENRAQF